jgi:hypothetical protein
VTVTAGLQNDGEMHQCRMDVNDAHHRLTFRSVPALLNNEDEEREHQDSQFAADAFHRKCAP